MNEEDRAKKKAWKLQRRKAAQDSFPLPEAALQDLFDTLDLQLGAMQCDQTNHFTLSWIAANGYSERDVVSWTQENGGYCDCEVLANTGDHFEQNRRNPGNG